MFYAACQQGRTFHRNLLKGLLKLCALKAVPPEHLSTNFATA